MIEIDESNVERLFPPIRRIKTQSVYDKARDALVDGTPEYFWSVPAASSYQYHNPYCCGERGLWIHTLMVSTAYERLVPSWVEQDLITDHEADLGRTAVLLHDLKKYGDSYSEGDHAARDHDLQAAAFVRDGTALDERVADAVATHMGPFDGYDGPTPQTSLQQVVHQADMAASTKNGTFGVYNAPDEIRDLYPSLPGASL